jgi:hypothetical protein
VELWKRKPSADAEVRRVLLKKQKEIVALAKIGSHPHLPGYFGYGKNAWHKERPHNNQLQ